MRQHGSVRTSNSIEPRMGAALDARLVVPTKADLYTYLYFYKGMIVSVTDEDKAYMLTTDNPKLETSWVLVGSSDDIHRSVATKTDLYGLSSAKRGDIFYVVDEDAYYKLINDLPSYEASWVLYADGTAIMEEISEADIDEMFN